MLKRILSVAQSPTTAKIVSTGYSTIRHSTQPKLAPMAFGGSVIAGVVSLLIGGYRITDCIRYQQGPGECDSAIERNLPGVITGAAAIFGSWGAFNTFNPKLHVEVEKPLPLPTKELVVGEKDAPAPHPEIIKNLYAEGNSQTKVAEMLGISVYAVRKALEHKRGKK